jgi:hypothetical protein
MVPGPSARAVKVTEDSTSAVTLVSGKVKTGALLDV